MLLAYNEEENLRVLLPRIKEQLNKCGEDYELLVIGGQTDEDNSREVCEAEGAVYMNQEEPGFGGAFRTGIRHAKRQKFFIMDSDGSHHPRYIPDIYHCFMDKRCDVAIGSRYTKGGVSNDSITSQIMSHTLNFVYGMILGVKAKDLSTDFRMYHTRRLKEVVDDLKCPHYDVLQEVILLLKLRKKKEHKKFTIAETPITFDKRLFGISKRKLLTFIISYMKTVFYLSSIRWKNRKIR